MHSNSTLDKVYVNVNFFVECTEVEGPGKRFCIWLQGCNIGCDNCINQDMLSFEPKRLISIVKIKKLIKEAKNKYDIEGITFLGGEPFLQAENLSYVAKYCHSLGLSVICFSGFKYKYLQTDLLKGSTSLLQYLDVLIDDIYIEKLEDNERNWVGSTNQTFYYLTDIYNREIEKTEKLQKIELHIQNTGVIINGEPDLLRKYKDFNLPSRCETKNG